jgi:hypothetical protein
MSDFKDKPIRVFISYSWSSSEHEQRVVDFAESLMEKGVDTILDKWYLKEGQDKYAFMEKMVTDSGVSKVLMICDEQYAKKADERKGGVGTETQIISSEIYEKTDQKKFIPIIFERNNEGNPFLPTFLKTRIFIDLSSGQTYYSEFDKLLRAIYNKPLHEKPVLGVAPEFIVKETTVQVKTMREYDYFKKAVFEGKGSSIGFCEDFFNGLIKAYGDFYVEEAHCRDNPIDELFMESVKEFKPYRDQFISVIQHIVKYDNFSKYSRIIFTFLEKALGYNYYVPGKNSRYYDNYIFINRELFSYLIAILINNEHFEDINRFINEKYLCVSRHERAARNYIYFNEHLPILEDQRKQRLKINRTSLFADEIKSRCDVQEIDFEDLMETDLILFLKTLFKDEGGWFPHLLVYSGDYEYKGFKIFQRAVTKQSFQNIKLLLNIESKQDLADKLSQKEERMRLFMGGRPLSVKRLINFDNLYE